MPDWPRIFDELRQNGIAVSAECRVVPVGGGDVSKAWKLQTAADSWFVKTGDLGAKTMFEAEAEGLRQLQQANAIRVPEPIHCGIAGHDSYQLLEWIALERSDKESDRRLGRRLAAQHRVLRERFGWHRDNTIGATTQRNAWTDDWPEFYRHQRLLYQLKLARKNGYHGELQEAGETLMRGLGRFFDDYRPAPSLLHGDLWAGNYAAAGGQPVIYDPAVYFGDREADLAMTQLFGGFGAEFYRAYNESWPLQRGHEQRLILYQLYHVLNHLNLFGAAYLARALRMLQTLNQLA
jgi:fructosamine-3-kinase